MSDKDKLFWAELALAVVMGVRQGQVSGLLSLIDRYKKEVENVK